MVKRLLIFLFALLFLFFLFSFQNSLFLAPPLGTTTVSYVRSFSTNQVATITSADLGQTVYALDGTSPLVCADLFGNDGQEEIFFNNGDRFVGLDSNNQQISYLDGRGLTLFRDGASLILRVEDGSNQEDKYLVVKSAQGNCGSPNCPSWYAHRAISIHALNSFNSYSAGQQISSLPFTTLPTCTFSNSVCIRNSVPNCVCNLPTAYWLTSNSLVLRPNAPLYVVASQRDFQTMAVYRIYLDSNGAVSLTQTSQIPYPIYPSQQPACYGSTSTSSTEPHRGNSMFHTSLCLVDSLGVCSGNYREYIFNNDFFRINLDGSSTQVGSWHDFSDQPLPIVQGGSWNFCAPYGTTFSHVDSAHVINLGTVQVPDYRLIVMWDSDGARTVSADISAALDGSLQVTPLWTTVGGSIGNYAAQQMAVGYVKGVNSGPHIINGRYVFDAATGQILADMNSLNPPSTNYYSFTDPRIWPTNSRYGYAIDRSIGFGAEQVSSSLVLQHLLPIVTSPSTPTSTVAPLQLTFKDVGTNLPSGNTPTGNTDQGGIIRNVNLCANYDLATNSISFDLVKVRNQQHASLLRAYDVSSTIQNVNQDKKDLVLEFLQQSNTAGHRGYDGWTFWNNLDRSQVQVFPPNAPSNLGAS